jgi:hypothetical protein
VPRECAAEPPNIEKELPARRGAGGGNPGRVRPSDVVYLSEPGVSGIEFAPASTTLQGDSA